MHFVQSKRSGAIAVAFIALLLCRASAAQEPNVADVIHRIDSAVQNRYENILGFTDIEHYSVYRGKDETRPVAEMTVRDTYKKGAGKTYTVLSQTGSSLAIRLGLKPLLDNETAINVPGNVEKSWFTSANYAMQLKPGGIRKLNGRDCYELTVNAKRKAPNMIDGTLWVDAQDGSIVRLDGTASQKPSVFAGATHMMRDYMSLDGFPMARHAHAESNAFLVGRIVVIIDYSDYHLQLKNGK